jgi:DNA-directed RNA polymerase specialized sigma24 family protein
LIDALFGLGPPVEYVPPSQLALRTLADARVALDGLERELVLRARLDGVTWRDAAVELRVSPTTLRARVARGSRPRRGFGRVAAGEEPLVEEVRDA